MNVSLIKFCFGFKLVTIITVVIKLIAYNNPSYTRLCNHTSRVYSFILVQILGTTYTLLGEMNGICSIYHNHSPIAESRIRNSTLVKFLLRKYTY